MIWRQLQDRHLNNNKGHTSTEKNLSQAAIDQLLEPDVLDAIVGEITPAICEGNPTEQCPAAVDGVIRQGLPMLAAAGDDSGFAQVRKTLQNHCNSVNMGH